jgi:diguanylate cyclase (GGDEF)-like protein
MMTFLGIDASLIFLFKLFKSELLAPISLGFGAMAIAHCFYSLRPAAVGVLVMGMLPTSLVMIATGNFEAKMIGCAMITVGILMIRFVADQYDRMIAGLFLEKQIRDLADSDPLTGLPNRRAIMAAIANEMQAKNGFGIALLDLDGFKQVNDSLGHQAGDLMLLGVGGRLSEASLESDSVARLGGDEFIVLFRNVADKGELAARTTALLAALCRPIDLDGHRLPVAASLGYAMYPDDGDTIREVMHAADTALYAEKRASKAARQSSPHSLPKVA